MAEDEGSASTSRRPLMLRHRSWRRRWRVGEFSSYVVGLLLVLIVLMQPPSSAAAVVDTATSATREATSSAWNSSHHNATASSDYLSVNATHQYGSKSNTTNTSINATAMVEPLPNGVTMCDGSDPIGVSAAYLLQQPLYYCMHYGKCVANFTQHPDQPCLCSSKYTGPHCEFRTGREPSDCTKHCFWGTCQNGAKSFEIAMNDYATPDDLQYCLCPPTASGEYCEREAQPCADGSHCLNGGTCVTVTTTTTAAAGRSSDNSLEGAEAYCDCTTAYTGPEAFEGVHCEHKVTTFCSDEVDANGHHWCTNGGTCRENSYVVVGTRGSPVAIPVVLPHSPAHFVAADPSFSSFIRPGRSDALVPPDTPDRCVSSKTSSKSTELATWSVKTAEFVARGPKM